MNTDYVRLCPVQVTVADSNSVVIADVIHVCIIVIIIVIIITIIEVVITTENFISQDRPREQMYQLAT